MKIIEMLRLSELGLSQREIATSSVCGKTTVARVLGFCKAKGITHEIAVGMTDKELPRAIYPRSGNPEANKQEPDWAAVREELAKHKNLNLQFLWEEYRAQYPDGLSYSRYCNHYRAYREADGRAVSLHQERKAGEIMEVDWIGDTLDCVVNSSTGELITAHFFVSIMGYSALPYVEAFPNELERNWITGNVNALHYYGGVPRIIVPDNLKAAVTTPKYYEPIINTAYWELARHYELAVIPARIRKPQDKAMVEQSTGWLETWLLGKLRNQRFFSFAELNQAIRKLLLELSARPFQKRQGSRLSEFQEIDKPALRPLPAQKYETADIVTRRVGDNYHVEYGGFHYSVPYWLHKEQVILRATGAAIEILDKSHNRVSSHKRRTLASEGRYGTKEEHMPPNHRAVYQSRQFDGQRYRGWASNIGENTSCVIESLLTKGVVEEQGYKSCMGVLQLSTKYGQVRLEAACKRAKALGSPTYTTVKTILKNGVEGASATPSKAIPAHENIRGGGYYK